MMDGYRVLAFPSHDTIDFQRVHSGGISNPDPTGSLPISIGAPSLISHAPRP